MQLLDEVKARATSERLISATVRAEKWVDVDEEVKAFDRRLAQPFDYQQKREAAMRLLKIA